MKVALLHNVNRGANEHEAEFDLPITIEALTQALLKEHEVSPVECTRDFTHWLALLTVFRPDIIFNVAEGYAGSGREAVYPAIYEQLGLTYCGPGPTELLVCHDKALAKKLLEGKGIPMPWGKVIRKNEDLNNIQGQDLPFPLIIKLNSEGSSMGMDGNCIVQNWTELEKQVSKVLSKYGSNVLVEQYIEGKDMSMSFIEGLGGLGPVQYVYPGKSIYDYELKTSQNNSVDVVQPKDLKPEVRQRLHELTSNIANILDINGYGRADFRITPEGDIYFLEMNAQVCFHPQGAFVLAAEAEGYSYDDVVLHIVQYAKENKRRTSVMGQ